MSAPQQQALQVAFVGLGNMGDPMVANLAKAGFAVRVFDADPARTEAVAARHGAVACHDAAMLADGVDVLVTMLPTGAVVRQVLLDGAGGLAARLRRGAIVVDMSSSEPLGTRELGERLHALGVALIDAPVSGGVPGAVAGSLSIMAGSDDAGAIDAVMPVFEVLGKRVFRTGRLGSGHAMKALNNYVAAAAYAATAEVLMIGGRFGLDEALMVEILNTSTGRSFNSEHVFGPHVVPRRFATGFALGLLTKDVGIARGLGEALEVEAPLSRLVHERWEQARDALGEGRDQSCALLAWGARP